MKIGILTYHRAENYGALLQAYGLKIYLSSLGHDVSFVDYWPEYHQKYHKILRMDKILYGSLKEKWFRYIMFFFGVCFDIVEGEIFNDLCMNILD